MGDVILTSEFLESYGRLTKDEQRRAFNTVAKFHTNPRQPGLQVKKMRKTDYHEIRVSDDLRIIAKLEGADLCCFIVGHHDEALARAERDAVGQHPDIERLQALTAKIPKLVSVSEAAT